jgi:hypothetical protein
VTPDRRRWTKAALWSAALLVIPTALWIGLPSPPSPRSAARSAAEEAAPAITAPPAQRASAPRANAPPAPHPSAIEAPGGEIHGVVVDERGAPVQGYWIAVAAFEPTSEADAGRPKVAREVDDPDGAFRLEGLAPGRYAIAAAVPHRPVARERDVAVRAGRITSGVRLVAAPGATVIGTITDARTHVPLGSASVFAEMEAEIGLKVVPAITQAGAYRLEGAPTGEFDLTVLLYGYEQQVVRGLRAPEGGEPLRVDVALHRLGEPAE